MFILRFIDRYCVPLVIFVVSFSIIFLFLTYPEERYGNYWTGKKIMELEKRIENLEKEIANARYAETCES